MTAVGRLVISRLLNFAAGLERVYDPFLFPVLGTKESIKKGKTIFAIQVAVYIYQKYIQCRFIYLFVLYSEISDRFPENGGNRYGSAPGSVTIRYSNPRDHDFLSLDLIHHIIYALRPPLGDLTLEVWGYCSAKAGMSFE